MNIMQIILRQTPPIRYNFLIVLLFCSYFSFGQPIVADRSAKTLFTKAKDLFENKQYASAEQVFNDYLLKSKQHSENAEARYFIAVCALELQQQDAYDLVNEFVVNYPEHPDCARLQFYLARSLFRDKKYDEALVAAEKTDAYNLTPEENAELDFMKGYLYFKDKNYDKAKSSFARIKEGNTDNGLAASYYYGYIAYEQGKYSEALKEFNHLKSDRRYKKVVAVYISQIYMLQGKYDEVISNGSSMLGDSAPDGADIISLQVAESYFIKKDYTNAVVWFDKFSGALNDHYLYEYGISLIQKSDYVTAGRALSGISIKEDSLGQNTTYNLGIVWLKLGDKNKARNAFSFASGYGFDKVIQEQSLLNYAKLSYELKFQKEGLDAFRLFLKNYPKSANAEGAKELLGEILVSSNNQKEALEVIESIPNRSQKLEEARQKIYYFMGIDLVNLKKYEEAVVNFKSSLENPVNRKIKALAYFWVGECRYKQAEAEKETGKEKFNWAIDSYKNFLYVGESQQTSLYSTANYNIGYCLFRQEDYTHAASYFEKYASLEKNNKKSARYTDAVLRGADCYFVLKNYRKAEDMYDDVIENKVPESDYAMYQKGIINGLQGDVDGKIATLRLLISKIPGSAYVDDAQYAIGEEYFKAGKNNEAVREFQSLNYNYPKSPYYRAAMLNIGLIYYNTDVDDKAIAVFKNIIKQYPYYSEAKEALVAMKNIYVDRGQADSITFFVKQLPNVTLTLSTQDSIEYWSAYSYLKRKDCDGAVKTFEKYLAKFPEGYFSTDAHYYAADCSYKLYDTAKAILHYNYVLNKSPNEFVETALKVSSDLYYKTRKYDIALNRYQQLEDIASSQQNVYLSLRGQMRTQFILNNFKGTSDAANKLLNLASIDDKQRLEAQFYLGKSQMGQNNLTQAQIVFTDVYKKDNSSVGAEAIYYVAYIQFQQEKFDDCEATILKLNDDFNDDYWRARGFILLSDVYARNDLFQAKSTLESVAESSKFPDIVEMAKQKIKEIEAKEKEEGN